MHLSKDGYSCTFVCTKHDAHNFTIQGLQVSFDWTRRKVQNNLLNFNFTIFRVSDLSCVHQSMSKKAKCSTQHTYSLRMEPGFVKKIWGKGRISHANVFDVSIQRNWIRISAHWCAKSVPAALSFRPIHWVKYYLRWFTIFFFPYLTE